MKIIVSNYETSTKFQQPNYTKYDSEWFLIIHLN